MGLIISVIARKGGVGKTTVAANLAFELASGKTEVRLLDTDPQGSLSIWASMGSGFLSTRVTSVAAGNRESLREAVRLAQLASDILIVDTPPGFTGSALLAARASDLVLLPCGASPLDLAAARDAVSLCREIQRRHPGGLPVIALVPSRYHRNSGLGRDLAGSLEQLGEATLPGIAHRVALAEAAISGLAAGEFAPNSAAHREFKELAKAVRRFTDEKRNETTQAQAAGLR